MTFPEIIPLVSMIDLALAAVVGSLFLVAPSRLTRALLALTFVYILIEAFGHVAMERLAAEVMRRWL